MTPAPTTSDRARGLRALCALLCAALLVVGVPLPAPALGAVPSDPAPAHADAPHHASAVLSPAARHAARADAPAGGAPCDQDGSCTSSWCAAACAAGTSAAVPPSEESPVPGPSSSSARRVADADAPPGPDPAAPFRPPIVRTLSGRA